MKNENVDYFSIFNDDFPKCDQNTKLRKNRSEKWKDMSSNVMLLQLDKAKNFTIDELSDEIVFCEKHSRGHIMVLGKFCSRENK